MHTLPEDSAFPQDPDVAVVYGTLPVLSPPGTGIAWRLMFAHRSFGSCHPPPLPMLLSEFASVKHQSKISSC